MGQGVCRGSVSGVFINYRGEDSDTAAVLIDRELAGWFGTDRVFLDSRSIPAGVDFVRGFAGAAADLQCAVGSDRAALADPDGYRRPAPHR